MIAQFNRVTHLNHWSAWATDIFWGRASAAPFILRWICRWWWWVGGCPRSHRSYHRLISKNSSFFLWCSWDFRSRVAVCRAPLSVRGFRSWGLNIAVNAIFTPITVNFVARWSTWMQSYCVLLLRLFVHEGSDHVLFLFDYFLQFYVLCRWFR
jgi:hypothetical protein